MKNSKSINFKSVLTKTFMAAGIAATGLTVANMNNNKAQAATTSADPKVVTIKANSVAVRKSASDYAVGNGQILYRATSWKVIDSAYDANGQKWYDLGKDQWVKASTTVPGFHTVAKYTASTNSNSSSSQASSSASANSNYSYNTNSSNNKTYSSSYSYSAPKTNYVSTKSNASTSYTSTATGSEASAKAWIANKESGGSYSATNGQYIGKYQLSASYLNGDYSAANQERVADNYVKTRYGSWTAAKNFWQANGWY